MFYMVISSLRTKKFYLDFHSTLMMFSLFTYVLILAFVAAALHFPRIPVLVLRFKESCDPRNTSKPGGG